MPPLPLARRDAGFLWPTPRDERGPPARPLPPPRRVRLTRGSPAAENGQRRRLSTASSQRRPAGVSYVGSGPFRRSPSILGAFLRSADSENRGIGLGRPSDVPMRRGGALYPNGRPMGIWIQYIMSKRKANGHLDTIGAPQTFPCGAADLRLGQPTVHLAQLVHLVAGQNEPVDRVVDRSFLRPLWGGGSSSTNR